MIETAGASPTADIGPSPYELLCQLHDEMAVELDQHRDLRPAVERWRVEIDQHLQQRA